MLKGNIGSKLKSVIGLVPVVVTAGGAADNVAQVGPAIDRSGYKSAVVAVVGKGVIASTKKVDVSVQVTHCATSGGTYVNYGSATTGTVVDGADESLLVEANIDLSGARQYIKISVTANPDAADTDTFNMGAVVVLGDPDVLPA